MVSVIVVAGGCAAVAVVVVWDAEASCTGGTAGVEVVTGFSVEVKLSFVVAVVVVVAVSFCFGEIVAVSSLSSSCK